MASRRGVTAAVMIKGRTTPVFSLRGNDSAPAEDLAPDDNSAPDRFNPGIWITHLQGLDQTATDRERAERQEKFGPIDDAATFPGITHR